MTVNFFTEKTGSSESKVEKKEVTRIIGLKRLKESGIGMWRMIRKCCF